MLIIRLKTPETTEKCFLYFQILGTMELSATIRNINQAQTLREKNHEGPITSVRIPII